MVQSPASTLHRERFNPTIKEPSVGAIFLIDAKGKVTSANLQAQKILGFTSAEVLGKHLQETMGFQHAQNGPSQPSRRASKRTSETGEPLSGECFLGKSGSVVRGRWSQARLQLKGQSVETVLIVQDLSDPAPTEQARQETHLRLTALLDSAMDGIINVDGEQRILMCNSSAEKLFGYTAGELVGSSLERLLPERLPLRLGTGGQPANISQDSVAPAAQVLRGIRSNGEEFPVEVSISQIEVRGRKFFTVTMRDVSERKRVEQALAESQERLEQSQKMAVIGQLAGGVAHDFNNLLTVIGGYAELVLANLPPEAPLRDPLSQIGSASSRAAALTRQLLTFSRKQVFAPQIVDLNLLIRDTEKMLRRLIGEDVALQTLLAPDLSPVRVDPSQIDQVLLNMVVNARDAMPEGGRLTLKTLNVELNGRMRKGRSGVPPGSYVVLAVSDTGCGMTAETQAQIFEPFFTTKSIGKGTGLGLAVVHGIVKQSAGHIVVQSQQGAGTTFKIYLPAISSCSVSGPILTQKAASRGCETVLFVEDEDALRALGSQVLESYGYRVLSAANGKEALQLAKRCSQKLDLLLTDIVMPGMSGCELAATLRHQNADLKVLLLSGYSEETLLHRGYIRMNGGAAFLNKPFSPTALATKVRQVLDDR